MSGFFYEVLSRPLFNFLMVIYQKTGDLGVAIIGFTLIIKLLLFPLYKKQIKSQQDSIKLQPKLKEIKKKYKGDLVAQRKAEMQLYKDAGVNPASSCFPLLIQLPIFLSIFWILNPGNALIIENSHFKIAEGILYDISFLKKINEVKTHFFSIIDLTKASLFLAILAGVSQFFYSLIITKKQVLQKQKALESVKDKNQEVDFQEVLEKQMKFMNYIFPVLTFLFSLKMPAGLPLYWTVSSVVSVLQHLWMKKISK